ncbi:MAG: cytochrome-c peroxidase, partial [Gammaproteobacteria bacterium]|nr:cytochrome-c peroxidase [Gammaproteobacteria bacterium]
MVFTRKSFLNFAIGMALCAPALTYAVTVPADARVLGLDALSTVPIPEPPNLATYVRDKNAAIALGKALFWDQQVGSDGQACASCHFHAGADNRKKNQLSPGVARVINPTRAENSDTTFGDAAGLNASGVRSGANSVLNAADFPSHKLTDPLDRNSAVLFDTNDVVSSQGTFGNAFVASGAATTTNDTCTALTSASFHVNNVRTRKVEPRNTPTTINAVFNFRNFWDGRANNIFNGLNPLGKRGNLPTATDANPGVLVMDARGRVRTVAIEIANASLASQAVGPALSDFEMSCAGRTFVDLGRKLLNRRALAFQAVSSTDSVLSGMRNTTTGLGLTPRYRTLVQRAFQPAYWGDENGRYTATGDRLPPRTPGGYNQMEVNFSLFWGLAIQLYEATLVSGQSPFDQWMEGNPAAAFGPDELAGLNVFVAQGNCVICHAGAEFTTASVRAVLGLLPVTPLDPVAPGAIERMPMIDTLPSVYDTGFYNIGARPT